MKITAIKLSVFELPATTTLFDLEQVPYGHRTRWQARSHRRAEGPHPRTVEIQAIRPNIDLVLVGQIPLAPPLVFVVPKRFEPDDIGRG